MCTLHLLVSSLVKPKSVLLLLIFPPWHSLNNWEEDAKVGTKVGTRAGWYRLVQRLERRMLDVGEALEDWGCGASDRLFIPFLRHWICFQDPLWEFFPPLDDWIKGQWRDLDLWEFFPPFVAQSYPFISTFQRKIVLFCNILMMKVCTLWVSLFSMSFIKRWN